MITPIIEKLIWEGKATWKVETIGASGALRINVPDNQWIIITGFTYFNFIDSLQRNKLVEDEFDLPQFLEKAQHQVRFRSKLNSYTYIMRDSLDCGLIPGFPGKAVVQAQGKTQYDCYQIHDDVVRIEICAMIFDDPFFFNEACNRELKYNEPFDGVGTSVTTNIPQLVRIDLTAGFSDITFLLQGKTDLANTPFLTTVKKGLEMPYKLINQLVYGAFIDGDWWRNMPLLNVEYVLINGKRPENMK